MNSSRKAIILTAVLAMSIAACGDDGGYGSPLTNSAAAFGAAGLEASKFEEDKAAIKKLGAKECIAGKVEGVHVTLCRYEDEAKAKAAKSKGLAAVGKATGLSLARGDVLMVAADRNKVDGSGRALNRIGKAFWGKR
jgi:hypothetical protein